MQNLATALHLDIGFLFKKQSAFDTGITALRNTDPVLAGYLQTTRDSWSGSLVHRRNEIEHTGWTLPRVGYEQVCNGVKAHEPLIDGTPLTEFVSFMLDRLCCFVEEFTAYGLQKQMPREIMIREIPPTERPADMQERFRVTLTNGGHAPWKLAYHGSRFEDT